MNHVVDTCPLTEFDGGLNLAYSTKRLTTQSYGWNLQRLQHSRHDRPSPPETKKIFSHHSYHFIRTPTPHSENCSFYMLSLFNFSAIFSEGVSRPHLPLCADVHAREISNNCVKLTTGRSHLRSANACLLSVPRTRTTYGDRSFAVSGPLARNSLPVALRSSDVTDETFRRQLKTFLFNCLDN